MSEAAPTPDPFDWTITPATRGYHVRHKDQVVRHFRDIETCARFIRNSRAELDRVDAADLPLTSAHEGK